MTETSSSPLSGKSTVARIIESVAAAQRSTKCISPMKFPAIVKGGGGEALGIASFVQTANTLSFPPPPDGWNIHRTAPTMPSTALSVTTSEA
jgi:hypothetical protein